MKSVVAVHSYWPNYDKIKGRLHPLKGVTNIRVEYLNVRVWLGFDVRVFIDYCTGCKVDFYCLLNSYRTEPTWSVVIYFKCVSFTVQIPFIHSSYPFYCQFSFISIFTSLLFLFYLHYFFSYYLTSLSSFFLLYYSSKPSALGIHFFRSPRLSL